MLFASFLLLSVASQSLAGSVHREACVPDITTWYWKSPCDDQKFPNVIALGNLTATQNGQSVDAQGGLDMSIPLKIVTTIVDSYGEITKPLVDIAMFEYAKPLVGGCTWKTLPTFGMLDNIDSCTIVDNCHMTGSPTILTETIDFKTLAGSLEKAIQVGSYYGFGMTFKDNDKPLLCVYSQSKVINK